MIDIDKKKLRVLIPVAIAIIAIAAWSGYTILHTSAPVRIGVLLPVTGDIELPADLRLRLR